MVSQKKVCLKWCDWTMTFIIQLYIAHVTFPYVMRIIHFKDS